MYEFAASLLYQLLTICDSWISNADLKESVCVYMYICVCVYIKIMLPYVYFFLWLNL